MSTLSQTLMDQYQIRKSRKQKAAFRAWLRETLHKEGYKVSEEKGNFSTNVVVGDPERAKVLFTAHYDTCAVLPIPNFITPRNFFFYLLYQLLLCVLIFGVAFGAEVAILLIWEDCPLWAVMIIMYALLFFMVWWILDGPANKHTANDNTSGVLTLLEIALALPAEQRGNVCFVFFDNEEKGLLGSAAFAAKHRSVKKNTLTINFDCVSDGDYIHFFPNKRRKKDADTWKLLEEAFFADGGKTVTVTTGVYPSDQRVFARGVGVCALNKGRICGYYMDKIHTNKDTVLDERNIALLRDGAVRLTAALSDTNLP